MIKYNSNQDVIINLNGWKIKLQNSFGLDKNAEFAHFIEKIMSESVGKIYFYGDSYVNIIKATCKKGHDYHDKTNFGTIVPSSIPIILNRKKKLNILKYKFI
jgi:hypothetical protein